MNKIEQLKSTYLNQKYPGDLAELIQSPGDECEETFQITTVDKPDTNHFYGWLVALAATILLAITGAIWIFASGVFDSGPKLANETAIQPTKLNKIARQKRRPTIMSVSARFQNRRANSRVAQHSKPSIDLYFAKAKKITARPVKSEKQIPAPVFSPLDLWSLKVSPALRTALTVSTATAITNAAPTQSVGTKVNSSNPTAETYVESSVEKVPLPDSSDSSDIASANTSRNQKKRSNKSTARKSKRSLAINFKPFRSLSMRSQ